MPLKIIQLHGIPIIFSLCCFLNGSASELTRTLNNSDRASPAKFFRSASFYATQYQHKLTAFKWATVNENVQQTKNTAPIVAKIAIYLRFQLRYIYVALH